MEYFPKISIITPSYNQGKFIEETITSVLGQGYPNLEYIIIDGGSTDETIEVIKKYADKLKYWVSEKDNGQSHAINKGFALATGDIIGWLNSDDMYLPGALAHVASRLDTGARELCFGNCLHFRQGTSAVVSWGSDVVQNAQRYGLENFDYIIQPSSFWTRITWEAVGSLSESLTYTFDWEWFLRARQLEVKFLALPKCLSMYRIHDEHKTGVGGTRRQEEILSLYRQYSERYAVLYALLRAEVAQDGSLKKIVKTALRFVGRPYEQADVLRIARYKKFKPYSWSEISNCLAML